MYAVSRPTKIGPVHLDAMPGSLSRPLKHSDHSSAGGHLDRRVESREGSGWRFRAAGWPPACLASRQARNWPMPRTAGGGSATKRDGRWGFPIHFSLEGGEMRWGGPGAHRDRFALAAAHEASRDADAAPWPGQRAAPLVATVSKCHLSGQRRWLDMRSGRMRFHHLKLFAVLASASF